MTEFERMKQMLSSAYCCRKEIVLCLIGPTGIGKTAAVMQHAQEVNANVVKIIASRCVPSEVVGMTMPNQKNHSMQIFDSQQISQLKDGDILFLDELLEADQMVLSALLTLIESRETASGKKLPDIQIIAATNATIPPQQLRGNIRQRFMFAKFEIDHDGIQNYIKDKYNIVIPNSILAHLVSNDNKYNYLSPRSLTKIIDWIFSVPQSQRKETALIIDKIWETSIGSDIYYECVAKKPESLANSVINLTNDFLSDEEIEKLKRVKTMAEILDILKDSKFWNEIKDILSAVPLDWSENAI